MEILDIDGSSSAHIVDSVPQDPFSEGEELNWLKKAYFKKSP